MYIQVKELPEVLQGVLRSVGYHKKDISVTVAETASLLCLGGAGQRGFAVIVNMGTGETKRFTGSWGGANMFNPENVIDLDQNAYTLPHNCAIVQGSEGSYIHATITVPPSNAAKFLPTVDESLTDKDKGILYAYGALKSGPYRNEELKRIGATVNDIDNLVAKGYLKKDGRGTQITTKGKNCKPCLIFYLIS